MGPIYTQVVENFFVILATAVLVNSILFCYFFHHVFISGAKEGVIVVWQLESGIKKFKPRLGSPLLYFSESVDLSTCYVRKPYFLVICSYSCIVPCVHLICISIILYSCFCSYSIFNVIYFKCIVVSKCRSISVAILNFPFDFRIFQANTKYFNSVYKQTQIKFNISDTCMMLESTAFF